MNKNNDSLRKRYFFKLASGVLGIPLSLVSQAIIPRGLGPKSYGDFNFLTSFFSQFIGFFDGGTALGFYTKLSQRPKEQKLAAFYYFFAGAITLALIVSTCFIHFSGAYKKLFPGQNLTYIYLAVLVAVFGWLAQIMNQMTDAYGLTVSAESAKMLQKVIAVAALFALFVFKKFSLDIFFIYNYLMFALIMLIFSRVIKRNGFAVREGWNLDFADISGYVKEFYKYSHPLFIYCLVGMVVGIFDRWILQVFGGSIQQGFYSLSSQVGVICFLFTSAMTPLITREFSIAHNNKDLNLMAWLFRKHIPLLYSITAFFSCFVAVNADKVALLIGGGMFKEASLPVAIMAFFPIHQSYGQLSGSLYYATGRTRLYRNIGIISMLTGLPVTYFLIAHGEMLGFNSGAVGLALKMVILQFATVNVFLYFNTRFLKVSFAKYIFHQFGCVIFLLAASLFSAFSANKLILNERHIVFSFLLSSFFYTLIVIGVVYFFPVIFGLKRKDWDMAYEKLRYYKQKYWIKRPAS